jgi:hypothetical protein
VQEAAEVAAEIRLRFGQDDRAVRRDPAGEGVLVVVDVLAGRLAARHDDRPLAHGRRQHDRARPAVADDDRGLAHHRLHLLVAQVLAMIRARRRRGRAGLDEAAGDLLAAVGKPGVDPPAQTVERMEVRPHRHEDEGEPGVQNSPPMTFAPG